MKKLHSSLYLSILTLMALLVACSSDPAPGDSDHESDLDTASQVIGQTEIPEVEIPQDAEREENLEKAASASPFSSLGCCSDEAQYTEDCCCDAVIELYREMVANADTSIARLKMTDPILSGCRKLHQDSFDEIDYPEEDDDDLVWLDRSGEHPFGS